MPTPTDSPVVVRDVFPARVVVGDRVLTTARVVLTRERVLVYTDRSGPVIDEPYLGHLSTVPRYNAPSREPAHLTLADETTDPDLAGASVTIARQRGCGCASPLRGWRPWQPYRVAAPA